MERNDIVSFLNYPDAPLVDLAVKRANLKAREWQTVSLREHDGLTVEETAEFLRVSPGTVKNEYRSAMNKLDKCWDGCAWVRALAKVQNMPQ